MTDISHVAFDPPGPGLWLLDSVHAPRPVSEMRALTRAAASRGFRIGMSRYGALMEGPTFQSVHRFTYGKFTFVASRPSGSDTLARQRFDGMVRAYPELQERFQRAENAVAAKRWRRDLQHWDEVGKPWLLARTFELTDVDPSDLSDAGLDEHARAVFEHLLTTFEFHHILNPLPQVPLGLLLVHTIDWTGVAPIDVIALMTGSSPVSAGDEPERRALAAAIRQDPGAAALLDPDDDPEARLDALRTRDGAVGRAARVWLRLVGYRTIHGWDPMDPYALESPASLLTSIHSAVHGQLPALDDATRARVRDRVPDAHRAEFDELLADARQLSRVRDERDIYGNFPVSGLLRRAVIEAGRRFLTRGCVHEVEHATEVSPGELRAMLAGGPGPGPDELAARYAYRLNHSVAEIPQTLGEPDQAPVPPDWLPPAAALIARAQAYVQLAMGGGPGQRPEEPRPAPGATGLRGTTASPGVYEGPARLVLGPHDFQKIQPGDVLVTTQTSPSFAIIFPKLGALVTDLGGPLSHAAIVAREFGLPAIVGTGNATQILQDGQRLRVDAVAGEVWPLPNG